MWPIHEGNLSFSAKPMDFDDDLIDKAQMKIYSELPSRRRGQPENCMITLLAILLDMLTTSDD